MPVDRPAAVQGGHGGWTVPLDYQRVHELFRVLRIGPYEQLGDITLTDLFDQYGPWIVVAIVLLLLAAGWASWVARLNTLGEMASGLAHELNHPLATINNYVPGCVRRNREGACDPESLLDALERASGEAERAAAAIIHSMREFIRKEGERRENVDINTVVREVSGLLHYEIQDKRVALRLELGDDVAPITADAVQVEQVILNLARNAIEAMGKNRDGPRDMQIGTASLDGGMVEITI